MADPTYRGLKILVLALGALLIGGGVLLAGTIAKKVSERKTRLSRCATPHMLETAWEGTVEHVSLEEGAVVIISRPKDELSPPSGQEKWHLTRLDACTGEVLLDATLTSKTPSP